MKRKSPGAGGGVHNLFRRRHDDDDDDNFLAMPPVTTLETTLDDAIVALTDAHRGAALAELTVRGGINTNDDIANLAAALVLHGQLKLLDLRDNSFGSVDIATFAPSLQRLPHLETLSMRSNGIDARGVHSLCCALMPRPTNELKRVKALHDFAARTDKEISFKRHDILVVTNADSEWWVGHLLGQPDKAGRLPRCVVQRHVRGQFCISCCACS
jgi:hypothetical protein